MIEYDSLEEFRDPQTYDLVDAGYDEDRPVIEQWARERGGPLLDLACGTGRMAIPMALQGYQVTGVDVVPEMVEWGLKKAARQGASIEWVVADARAFHLQQRFQFIYMLAHAFQFFHTRADLEALLARVREHLTPEGCFLFDTRNPSRQNLYETHHPAPQKYTAPDGRQLVVTEDQQYDPMTQIQHYASNYRWLHPDGQQVVKEKTIRVALRYVFPQEIEALLHYNGFQIRACYGSWQQEPLTATSREMIYVCQRRV
ncbi:MAG: class I SAM-dependent methyltransferase [Ktedonobacterales bacterium]